VLKSDDTRRTRTWNLWLRGPTPYRPARDPVRLSCATFHVASTSPIYTEAFFAQGIHCIDVSTPCGTRTRNLRIRSPTPCPLGQGGYELLPCDASTYRDREHRLRPDEWPPSRHTPLSSKRRCFIWRWLLFVGAGPGGRGAGGCTWGDAGYCDARWEWGGRVWCGWVVGEGTELIRTTIHPTELIRKNSSE
jgi:hypothetical protein